MGDWLIKNVPEDVKDAIKQRARDYGGTIPQVLAMMFDQPSPKKDGDSWLLHNIDSNTRQRIMEEAWKNKETVGEFFDSLLDAWDTRKETERTKEELRRALLNEFRKLLKSVK